MRKILHAVLLASALALPAGAQTIQGILVEPASPTTRDRIELTVVGTQRPECPFVWKGGPVLDPATETFVLTTSLPECGSSLSPGVEFRKTFVLDPVKAGTHYARVVFAGLKYGSSSWTIFQVVEPSTLLELAKDNRFWVYVHWKNPKDGSEGTGYARRLAEDSGAFWFFTPDNLEVTVKILDGRPLNGHWWVFIASMTDLEMHVTVMENRPGCLGTVSPSCPRKTYSQTAGQNRNFVDVNAFPE